MSEKKDKNENQPENDLTGGPVSEKRDDAKYCELCGHPKEDPPQQQHPSNSQKR